MSYDYTSVHLHQVKSFIDRGFEIVGPAKKFLPKITKPEFLFFVVLRRLRKINTNMND